MEQCAEEGHPRRRGLQPLNFLLDTINPRLFPLDADLTESTLGLDVEGQGRVEGSELRPPLRFEQASPGLSATNHRQDPVCHLPKTLLSLTYTQHCLV